MAKTTTKTKARKKTKARRKVRQGNVYIKTSYNNTIVTVTDATGQVLASGSSGRSGFSGARKATPFAAQKIVGDLMERIQPFGMEEIKVYVKGIGSAREAAIRALSASGMDITALRDITPIPHNGVRPPKRRRV